MSYISSQPIPANPEQGCGPSVALLARSSEARPCRAEEPSPVGPRPCVRDAGPRQQRPRTHARGGAPAPFEGSRTGSRPEAGVPRPGPAAAGARLEPPACSRPRPSAS
eukprot:927475-Pyramimonas_sp.AAC.1